MGLFGKPKKAPQARVLRAAGQRIDPAARESLKALSKSIKQQSWQQEAWGYRDLIGELRLAVQFLSRAVCRVTFFPAQLNPESDQPIPFDADEGVVIPEALRSAAREELARLPLSSGYRFLGVFTENMIISGEAWLNGFDRDGMEVWEVRSVDEIKIDGEGRITIAEVGRPPRVFTGEEEELLRNWIPHPRHSALPDSPMRPLLNPCEDIILAGMESRAASRSRVASNGVFKVPFGLTMFAATNPDGEMISADDNRFMSELTAALLAPISNEGDPGAVVPIAVVGTPEDLEAFQHMSIERATANDLLERQEAGLKRLARGMDLPPEQMTGMGDMNHWSLWGVDMQTYRNHLDPWVRTIADSLLEGFLRPALIARGFSVEDVAKIVIDADASALTENVNRGQDAMNAYDRGAITRLALAEALGFSETDMPDDEELLRMIAIKQGVDPQTATVILQRLLMGGSLKEPIVVDSAIEAPAEVRQPQAELPAAGPGRAPAQATPEAPGPGAVVGAAVADKPRWRVATQESQRLADIDRALIAQIITAADPIIRRSVERANGRLRSLAQKHPEYKALVAGKDIMAVAPTLGREGVLALGASEAELVREALDELEGRFATWTTDAIAKAVDAVIRLLGHDTKGSAALRIKRRLSASMERRIGGAWSRLRGTLNRRIEKYLFDPTPNQEPGEMPDSLVLPGPIRVALAEVGGLPHGSSGIEDDGTLVDDDEIIGGIGTGQDVADLILEEGGETLGFEWRYGITPLARQFEPHRRIDGQRFTGPMSPELSTAGTQYTWVGPFFHPGDHPGCMCDSVPIWAIPEYDRVMSERLSEDTPYMASIRRLAEQDDRAGRKGTTAQRTRDERDEILALQKRYITRGGGNAA